MKKGSGFPPQGHCPMSFRFYAPNKRVTMRIALMTTARVISIGTTAVCVFKLAQEVAQAFAPASLLYRFGSGHAKVPISCGKILNIATRTIMDTAIPTERGTRFSIL